MNKKSLSLKQALARADQLESFGNLRAARDIYRDIKRQYPGNRTATEALSRLKVAEDYRPGPNEQAAMDQCLKLYHAGRFEDARQLGERIRTAHPRNPYIANLLGMVYAQLGMGSLSVRNYESALALKPDYPEAYSNFAAELMRLDRVNDAAEMFRRGLQLKPDATTSWLGMGTALHAANRFDEAEEAYRECLARDPAEGRAWTGIAQCLIAKGKLDAARAAIDKALEINADHAFAYTLYSRLGKLAIDDPKVTKMEELAQRRDLPLHEAITLRFSLGTVYEGAREIGKAIAHYHEGNALRRQELKFDFEPKRRLIARIRSDFAELPDLPAGPPAGPPGPVPIFILGMPRSGTTLSEQILAGHSQVHAAGELPFLHRAVRPYRQAVRDGLPLGPIEAAAAHVRKSYFDQLALLKIDKPFVTDKMPANSEYVGFIRAAFPEARIIHTDRDPVAVCWSIYKMNFRSEQLGYGCDMAEVAEYFALIRDLMAFWHERYPGAIFDLPYEKLTEDPEAWTRKLLEYCGLPFEEACLNVSETDRAINTMSSVQIKSGIYTGSSKAWHRFAPHLEPMLAALESHGVEVDRPTG